jgi:hypothetical protein
MLLLQSEPCACRKKDKNLPSRPNPNTRKRKVDVAFILFLHSLALIHHLKPVTMIILELGDDALTLILHRLPPVDIRCFAMVALRLGLLFFV